MGANEVLFLGYYIDCKLQKYELRKVVHFQDIGADSSACVVDFRLLSQEMEAGKELSVEESEYLMALFGTFPPDSEI